MIRCEQCGALNRSEAHYCTKCGSALGAVAPADPPSLCPHCGVPLRPESRFCPACGRTVAGVTVAQDGSIHEQKIVVRWPGGESEEHALDKSVVHIGRAPDNDIVLNFPTVSGHHLALDVTPSDVRVTDLNSTNGTMLKGRLITPRSPHPWREGETLRVGDVWGNSISIVLKGAAAPALHTYPLGMHRLAQHARILIGRDPASQITLDHPTVSRRHAEIVRQEGGHAIRDLGSVNGTFVNGQRVLDVVRLQEGDVIQLGPYKMVYDGDADRLSTSVSQGHRLDAIGLGVEVGGGRMILQDVSLSVQGGEFAALVGGSGAGKSTLLKAMNGFRPATHGRMLIDGELLYPNLAAYRTLMGYVPQDDIIHKTLPVRSALWYSARLRLPDATSAEIEERIDRVLELVELTAHQHKPVRVLSGGQRKRVSIAVELLADPDLLFLDEPTSGLDPGLEKKMMYDLNRLADQGRTVVLVTHATANIEQCDHVGFLERGNLAYYGPPNEAIAFFKARDFADIYLKLSEPVDGFRGALPSELRPYWDAIQARLPEEARGQSPGVCTAGLLWAQHYRASDLHQRYVVNRQARLDAARPGMEAAPARRKRTRDSVLRQLVVLVRRQFDLIRHDLRTLFILLLMMPLIAVLFMLVSDKTAFVGGAATEASLKQELLQALNVTREDDLSSVVLDGEDLERSADYMPYADAKTLVTMLGLALTQAGTFGAAYEIVKERPIFRRERSVNLRVGAYVLSKALVLGVFAVIQVASVLGVLALKLDLGIDPILDIFAFGAAELFVTLLIAVVASIMFGLFISAVVPSQDVVLYIILIQLFTQIILSGTLFPLGDNPASKLVPSYWTMDAMGATVDLRKLNDEGRVCKIWEQKDVPTAEGTRMTQRGIVCETAAIKNLDLPWKHDAEHLLTAWGALGAQALVWMAATMVVQSRVKGD
ncbi:MAG: FHA domain-containing protein [Anaerolineae bacterium]